MELTTGAILRRITRTELSVSAHKLATLILDGIAWKDGYNGLPRGTAAFSLADLAESMSISRQYLHTLLVELAESGLQLTRNRMRGRLAAWQFRFGCFDEPGARPKVSAADDTVLYKKDIHKTVFSGMIVFDRSDTDVSAPSRWIEMINSVKSTLPCRLVDSRHIWGQFVAFNRRRGNQIVPAGYLLGFMRRWRRNYSAVVASTTPSTPIDAREAEIQRLIAAAPVANRQFHESDLQRRIGAEAYRQRVDTAIAEYDCSSFTAKLLVHGLAVRAGEIRP